MEWTTENTKWFFGLSPPRQVDETLLNDMFNVIFPKIVRVLFSVLPVVMLVTMGTALVMVMQTADLKGEWLLLTEPTVLTSGRVLDLEMRKGSKGAIIYVYKFEFKQAGGEASDKAPVKGVCFSGAQVASPGQTVQIEYIPDDPKVSLIQGCRLNPVSLAPMVAMPFVGLIAVISPLAMVRYKRKWLERLLTIGVSTPAMIEKIKPGPKGSLVVEVRYDVAGVELKSKMNTSGRKPEKEWLMSRQESDQPLTIVVDPNKPKSVFILDLLWIARKGNSRSVGI
jgi:hypothetical protein